jgi:hypothetical protein
MKYAALCLQWKVNPRDDLPSASWNRRQWLCGGADAGFISCYAACACGTKLRREPAAALERGAENVVYGGVVEKIRVGSRNSGAFGGFQQSAFTTV